MYWNDTQIRAWGERGGVTPFDPAHVNPASLDLTVGQYVRRPCQDGWGMLTVIPASGLVIRPNEFILLATAEFTTIPVNAVAFLYLKSTTGRKGLEHLHAGYGDPGFAGEWTLEVINHWPYPRTIHAGERLFQLCLAECAPVSRDYSKTGHYHGQRNPTVYHEEGVCA